MSDMKLTRRLRSLAAAGAAACAGALALSAPALADETAPVGGPTTVLANVTGGSVAECVAPQFSHPFAAFGDWRSYVLAPGGDFAAGAPGWQLAGGARVVADTHGGNALDLPAGAVAVSPAMCVNLSYPTARTWFRNVTGKSKVTVGVAYAGTRTATKPRWVGKLEGKTSAWALSGDFDVRPEIAGRTDGWRQVAFVFVSDKAGGARIDDFFVDPRFRP
jgi:hypothetical protein